MLSASRFRTVTAEPGGRGEAAVSHRTRFEFMQTRAKARESTSTESSALRRIFLQTKCVVPRASLSLRMRRGWRVLGGQRVAWLARSASITAAEMTMRPRKRSAGSSFVFTHS